MDKVSQNISQIGNLLASILHDIEKYFNYLVGNDKSTLLEEKSIIIYEYLNDIKIKIGNECIYISNEESISDIFESHEIIEPLDSTEFSKKFDEIVKSECFSNAEIHNKDCQTKNLRVLIEYLPLEPQILSGNLNNAVAKTTTKFAENVLKIDIDPVILSTNDLMIQECYNKRVSIVLEKLPFITSKCLETEIIKTEAQEIDKNFKKAKILHTNKKVNHKKRIKNKKYQCSKCKIPRYFQLYQLKIHEKTSHIKLEKPIKCSIDNCTLSFYTHASYTNHKNLKHSNCSKCPEKFNSKFDLHNHLKSKHKNLENIFKCSKCPKFFQSFANRHVHYQKIHENLKKEPKILCEFENCKKFLIKSNVVSCEFHKLTHNIKDFKFFWNQKICPVCRKYMKDRELGKKHLISVHYPEILLKNVCKSCDKVFKAKWKLREHELTHLKTDSFKCTICDLKYNSKICLKTHTKNKHVEYKCTLGNCAGKPTFVGLTFYENHLSEHHDQNYICSNCPKLFVSKPKLDGHIHKVHRVFRCNFKDCKEIFKSEERLTKHGVFHDREKKPEYLCAKCGKNYWTKRALKEHVQGSHEYIEKNKHKFKCVIEGCNKYFFNISLLENHKISHSKQMEKQEALKNYKGPKYECDQCDKVYTQSQSLRFHVRNAHLNKRDFACDFENCNKKYNNKNSLTCHREAHIAKTEQRFQCKFCEKSYTSNNLLNQHIRKFHKEKRDMPFKSKIPDCGESFYRNKFLQTHLETNHKI